MSCCSLRCSACGGLFLVLAYYITLPFIPGILLWTQLGYIPATVWPTNLPRLLYYHGPLQQRHLGMSEFADKSKYKTISLSEDEKQKYKEDGVIVMRDVLPPELLTRLRTLLYEDGGATIWPWSINGYLSHDELLDFYLFSNLGDIVTQLSGEEVTLWSDFRYFRAPGEVITPEHYDADECEGEAGMLPPDFFNMSRVRIWVSLDDDAPGPPMMPTSVFRSDFTEEQLAEFNAGRFGDPAAGGDALFTELASKHRDRWMQNMVFPHVRLGDVIVHSPCLWHQSPVIEGKRVVGFLAPTYQPASSRFFSNPRASPERARRRCLSGLKPGDRMDNNTCFLPASPNSEQLRGKTTTHRFGSSTEEGTRFHWFLAYTQRLYSKVFFLWADVPSEWVKAVAMTWQRTIYAIAPSLTLA
mmetsp:Transcript_55224/g.131641  ORF Transcript_55224/g.131641 Transcript_55224/m.131641 type:complete len:413 (-) Transcript_55224:163-1401(-)